MSYLIVIEKKTINILISVIVSSPNESTFVLNIVSYTFDSVSEVIQLLFSFHLVKHSKCRSDFLNRVKQSEQLKRAAKESGKPVPASSLKRQVRHQCLQVP